MKESISTLMDGELYDDEAAPLLSRIKSSPEAQEDWRTYHLIGDVLRQPDHISRDISLTLQERLRAEPTVLAPRLRLTRKVRNVAMSAVATVSAVGVVAWMVVQIQSGPSPDMAKMTAPAATNVAQAAVVQPARTAAEQGKALNREMDDYLVAHQEVSPSTEMAGGTTYIHTVSAR